MAELKLLLFSFTFPLALILLAFLCKGKRFLSGFCFLLGFLWIYLPSTHLVAVSLAEKWQYSSLINAEQVEANQAQAIVVLSGGYNFNSPEYPLDRNISSSSLLRLRYAAELAKQYDLPILIAGGKFPYLKQPYSLAAGMANVMQEEFATSAQWLEEQSLTTALNAQHSSKILQKEQINSIILVTDSVHMPRSILSFERYGFTVVAAPTAIEKNTKNSLLFRLIPRAEDFALSKKVMHEILGYWTYHFHQLPKS